MSQPAIEISGLSKRYVIQHESRHDNLRDTLHHSARKIWRRFRWGTGFDTEEFWALRDLSLTVQSGEVLGIIGRNGAGKSTLLKILSRITEPTQGTLKLNGRVASLLEVGTGFHPELSGRENVFLNGAILGMSRQEIRRKFDEIVAFAEVERFLDTPVKRYSSGMYVRLAFAVAAHLEPDIFIVDEVLAVGDVNFQKKCMGKMNDVAKQEGRTILFVSHNMTAIQNLCTKAILLDQGRLVSQGGAGEIVSEFSHRLKNRGSITVGQRRDRTGTGAVRFISIKTPDSEEESPSCSVQCGQDLTLQLRLQNNHLGPIRKLHISIAIRDYSDVVVCYANSDVRHGDFHEVKQSAEINVDVTFEKLQMIPGSYTITLYSRVNEDVADWVKEALPLEVLSGDYYGTGKLPPSHLGGFLANYHFSLHS